ncbi:eCIS core domain-containing protein [Pseudomonas sp. SP16.1]|uniref:eCIS core domain-containing protein n=1 Tax=Pseudomonas sp. SP16.1 TaxID=3458854 RepID=UPI004046787B
MPQIAPYFRRALLSLLLGLPAAALAQCPSGQVQVCLGGSCLCMPDPVRVREDALDLAASRLEAWLLQSRQVALGAGTEPMPLMIRAQLAPYYDAELLDEVRFRAGMTDQLDAASAMLQNPDVQAVTLVDVVVFRHREDAERDVALWAHELWHVQQYRDWGTAGFARRYTRDFQAVEAPAYEMQARVRRALREQE